MKKDSSQDLSFYIIGWCCIAFVVIYYVLKHICNVDIINYTLPCTLYTWTGFYCPGCGGTRSIAALLQGDILESFHLHPFVPYTVFVGGWFMISQTIERISKGKIKVALHFRMIYMWIAVALILTNFLWKNYVLLKTNVPLL